MYLEELRLKQGISVRTLAKRAEVPYTTMLELVRGKKSVERAAAETVFRISNVLNVSMEEIIVESIRERERKEKEMNEEKE